VLETVRAARTPKQYHDPTKVSEPSVDRPGRRYWESISVSSASNAA
jgi:hypothetical protein